VRTLQGVTIEGAERNILRKVCRSIQDGKNEDAVMLAMKDLETAKGKTLQSLEWTKEEGLWRFRDWIYVLMIPDLH
jgi:hypothetical protein